MIAGVHAIVFADDAAVAREFVRDVLGLDSVDADAGEMGLYEPRHPSPLAVFTDA